MIYFKYKLTTGKKHTGAERGDGDNKRDIVKESSLQHCSSNIAPEFKSFQQ